MDPFPTFCYVFFSFTIFLSLYSLLLYAYRSLVPRCNCNVCRSYLTKSWLEDFDSLSDWYTHLLKNSPTLTIHVHILNCIITANPTNVEHILTSNFNNYPKGKPFAAILGDLLGKGIFVADGDTWKFQRKMADMHLKSSSMRNYAFKIVMEEINEKLIPHLSSHLGYSSVVYLQDVFRRFSMDNICKFSFGYDPECLTSSSRTSEFNVAFETASRISAERALSVWPWVWKVKRFLNLGTEKKLKKCLKVVNALAEEVIEEKKKYNISPQDLLSRFMRSVDDDRYLRDIVPNFLLAGRDTVSSGLTSFFWLLARHPEIQSAIREETGRVLKKERNFTSFHQLSEMHYLNAALYESMRIFPPIQFDSKYAEDHDLLPDNTFVRKGTRVMYHQYAMGGIERIWGPDYLQFRPERWLKNGVFVSENEYKYPVFQGGYRTCLGKELGLMTMKCVAVAILNQFDVCKSITELQISIRFIPGLTSSIRGGTPVLMKYRKT